MPIKAKIAKDISDKSQNEKIDVELERLSNMIAKTANVGFYSLREVPIFKEPMICKKLALGLESLGYKCVLKYMRDDEVEYIDISWELAYE